MSIKLVDTLEPMADFPAAVASHPGDTGFKVMAI